MVYVDGFLLSVPEDKLDVYREMAEGAGKVWMDNGALAFKECVADDVDGAFAPGSFPKAAGTKEGEVVMFSFIIFKSREHRDEVNAKVHEDERMKNYEGPTEMPFDIDRMAYGGFKTLVDL